MLVIPFNTFKTPSVEEPRVSIKKYLRNISLLIFGTRTEYDYLGLSSLKDYILLIYNHTFPLAVRRFLLKIKNSQWLFIQRRQMIFMFSRS